MSGAVPSSKPPSSTNLHKELSKSGFLHPFFRLPRPSDDEISAFKNAVVAIPSPSMGLFNNSEGDYQVRPYWGSEQNSTGLARELHLIDVLGDSLYKQHDGWSTLIVDKNTNLNKVADALSCEVDRVRTIVDRARKRTFVAQDPETGMRLEGRVCPSVYDTLNDRRASEYLLTATVLGLGAMHRARQKTDEGPASSERLTELENFAQRLFEIESKAFAPFTSCADLLPLTEDVAWVSGERASGTDFGEVMEVLLEERQRTLEKFKEAAEFTKYGWKLVVPIPFEQCTDVSEESILDSARRQMALDVAAGVGGLWRSEQKDAATERALAIV